MGGCEPRKAIGAFHAFLFAALALSAPFAQQPVLDTEQAHIVIFLGNIVCDGGERFFKIEQNFPLMGKFDAAPDPADNRDAGACCDGFYTV